MKRNKFLSLAGLSFLAVLGKGSSRRISLLQTDCKDPVSLAVPEGPFYKDEKLNRAGISEHKKGTPVEYHFKVEDIHCRPLAGAIVDIWQCDTDGHYSDFKQENSLGETWLRGYQKTGVDGKCIFESIFPGWYNGRLTHLHAKVHVNEKTVLTTNFFFPKEAEKEIHSGPLYPKGPNPVAIQQDIELHGDKDASRHDNLLMKMSKNSDGKWMAHYTIALA